MRASPRFVRTATLWTVGVMASSCQWAFPLDTFDSQPAGVCPASGPWLCDDFEHGLDATKWSIMNQKGGTLGLTSQAQDAVHVHRGNASLHVSFQLPSATPEVDLVHAGLIPSSLYARVFVYVPASLPPIASPFIVTMQDAAPYQGVQLSTVASGTAASLRMTDWGNTPSYNATSQSNFPVEQWVCLEWNVDSTTGSARVWVNGTEVTDLRASGLVTPPYGWLKLGQIGNQIAATGSFDLWMDDFYADTAPVGCSK